MHSWVTWIRTRGYIDVIKGNPDLHKYHPTDDLDLQVKYPHMHKYSPPRIWVNQVLAGTYRYPQPKIYFHPTATDKYNTSSCYHIIIICCRNYNIVTLWSLTLLTEDSYYFILWHCTWQVTPCPKYRSCSRALIRKRVVHF